MDRINSKIVLEAENHFVDNVLNTIIKTYSDKEPEEYSYDVSSMRGIVLNSLQKVGIVSLPRTDNFFFPQDLYVHSDIYKSIPLEYMHTFLPSIPTSHFFNGYLYTSAKLANIAIFFEKSNVFVSAIKKIRETIENDRQNEVPKHLCYMYYVNFFDSDYSRVLELNTINSIKFDLWLHFPVHKKIEKKYIDIVKHKLRYPETKGDLVIKVSCTYDLIYEELLI